MNRNQFDTDVSTWSTDGRLYQVEYAMQSLNQGMCSLGLRSNKYAVLAAIKRSTNELSSFQEKVFKIDDHMGIAIAGLTSDARTLATHMRSECLNYKYLYGSPMVTGRLVAALADKHQKKTMASWRRPYGVGMLVIGADRDGPHLYQTCPSGNFYEYKAMAIGNRSQSAKTYLEKHAEKLDGLALEDLIMHALKALEGASNNDEELDASNTSVAVVGVDHAYVTLSGESLQPYIDAYSKTREPKSEMETTE